MGTEIVQYSIPDIEKMARAIAKSGLFGIKTADQALALMLIAQAEGRHPVEAARDYNIIQGRPAKTAEAMLRDFLSQGGKVEWHELTDKKADATFSHPAGGTVRIDWDFDRAKKAGLGGKDNWSKYPRQMLRSRVISEGVRSVCPAATSGMYVPEEVKDFDEKPMKDITPKLSDPAPINDEVESLKLDCRNAAMGGGESLDEFLKSIPKEKKKHLAAFGPEMRKIAIEADKETDNGQKDKIPAGNGGEVGEGLAIGQGDERGDNGANGDKRVGANEAVEGAGK